MAAVDTSDSHSGLTSSDAILIKNSWAGPRQKPTETGAALLKIFFKNHPEYLQAFPFRDIPIEDLPNNKRYLAHGNSVIYGISSIIDAIDDPEMMVPILSRIGESHASRNIDAESFSYVKESLLELFSGLFSEDEVAAWRKALDGSFSVIVQGFKEKREK